MSKKRINELFILNKDTISEQQQEKTFKSTFKLVSIIFFIGVFTFSLLFTVFVFFLTLRLPDVATLPENSEQNTLIYDVNDKLIANIHGDENRENISIEKMSPRIKYAVIAIEDNRFYEHKGVDLTGILRAVYSNISNDGGTQGGSTITQQLIKNSYLSSTRSMNRKIIEAILAIKTEKNFEKNKILEMYLNKIYWGNQTYGIQKASKKYFNTDAKNLSLAQSAYLAGMIKAPEAYSPYNNYEKGKIRQKIVLDKMVHYGYITEKQRKISEKENLHFKKKSITTLKYPYFTNFVLSELRKELGFDIVKKGGLKVYTTLDSRIQQIAEETLIKEIAEVSSYTDIKQGALVSINPSNGYIQALVGGVDFQQSNFNRATQSKRAAGSSFKPIVYLTGLRLGMITSDTEIIDSPISFNTGWNVWRPKNWDGKYMGKMTVRQALSLSRNTPTVRIALKVGIDNIIKTARMLGLRGKISRNYSIALGSLGISPLEMASVFSVFAREGALIEPIAIRRIEDNKGNVLQTNTPNPVQIIPAKYVQELNSILVDVVEKGTGKRARIEGLKIAGKTGTSDEVRDIWFTGYTPDMVTTIWLGNDENTPLKHAFSSNCAIIWKNFATKYYTIKKIPRHDFNFSPKEELSKDQILERSKNPLLKNVSAKKRQPRTKKIKVKAKSEEKQFETKEQTFQKRAFSEEKEEMLKKLYGESKNNSPENARPDLKNKKETKENQKNVSIH
ncbi:MAG: PBP1A family penicillin-binding protein [Candidatus Gastranaerophilales bacterium]|nr:PBP1A family penicillin-binding protein [Candidatus Gastranaerophilales bacterium]